MSGQGNKYDFFQKSQKILVPIIFVSFFVSFFMENKFWDRVGNFILFLFGIHILFFLNYWVEYSVKVMENYFKDKPGWYQKGMAIKKNPLFTKIFFIVVAILSILFFLLDLI